MLLISLVVLVSFAFVGGIVSMFNKDTDTISASAFSRGGLDENGDYVSTNKTVYTKEMFGCKGLRIVPDFESNVTYDVYYYDYNGNFVEARMGLTKTYDEDFPLAKMARIVIHPAIPVDVDEEDFEIGFFDVRKVAKTLDITVDENQDNKYSESINLYEEYQTTIGKTFQNTSNMSASAFSSKTLADMEGVKISSSIAVTGENKYYDVYVRLNEGDVNWPITALFDSTGKCIEDDGEYVYDIVDTGSVSKPAWVKMTIEVPELETYEGVHLMVTLPEASDCYIFGYNN